MASPPAPLAATKTTIGLIDTQKRWKCKECGKQFSVKVGTVFVGSPLSLKKWLPALWMLVK
jgi:transposase-like protein